MIYVELPGNTQRLVSFYLAAEEFVAREKDVRDAFFMWQVEPSVIFGRNQLIDNEVNIDYCHENGIRTFRRKSGGGCVYADRNNVMFSYFTSDDQVGVVFHRYLQMVVMVLRELGIDAHASGRNDVMIGDRKVSGNAFYKIGSRSIVHGTMLYDTNMEHMVGAITPSGTKLVSKGVKSVRQRIALLKDYTDMPLEAFKQWVRDHLCTGTLTLGATDVSRIEEMEKEYLSDEFIYGNNPRYTVVRRQRIDGVGELWLSMELKNNIIKAVDLKGDYFLVGDIGAMLAGLKGKPLEADAIAEALPEKVEEVVCHLSREQLVRLILE